jgi:hypothetical protein
MAKYNQTDAPSYPLGNIDVPIALFSGSLDSLADPIDVSWLVPQLGNNVIFSHEYVLSHQSFFFGKNMSFFQVDVVNILKKYATN